MDQLDREIKASREEARVLDEMFEERKKYLAEKNQKYEEDRELSRMRAERIRGLSITEIKSQAVLSLHHVAITEDGGLVTVRKKLYHGTAGDQQSLFFKQIWDPFTNSQHGKMMFLECFF